MPARSRKMAGPVLFLLFLRQNVRIIRIVKKDRLASLYLREEISLSVQVVRRNPVGRSNEDRKNRIVILAPKVNSRKFGKLGDESLQSLVVFRLLVNALQD